MFESFAKAMLLAVGLLVVISLALSAVSAASNVIWPLCVLIGLVILLRIVWARTRW